MTPDDVCETIGPLVEAFRDGLLDDQEGRRVAAHLAVCARCGDDPLSAALRARSLYPEHRVDAGAMASRIRGQERVARRRWWLVPAAVSAAAAMLLAASSSAPSTGRPRDTPESYGSAGERPESSSQHRGLRSTPVGLEVLSEKNVSLHADPAGTSSLTSGQPPRRR